MKRVQSIFGFAVILCCLTFVNVAQAQEGRDQKEPPTYAKLLEEMDANEDGKLAASELKGPLKKDFAKIDTDEDGFISEAEFKEAPKPKGRK